MTTSQELLRGGETLLPPLTPAPVDDAVPCAPILARGTGAIEVPASLTHGSTPPLPDVADAISPWLLDDSFLRIFDTEQLRTLCESGVLRGLAAEEVIYGAGELASSIYFVVEGEVELLSPRGGTRRPGELLGESAIVSDALRAESARARSDAMLVEFPTVVLRDLLSASTSQMIRQCPSLAQQLAIVGLRQTALFKDAGEDALATLGRCARLEPFARGQLAAEKEGSSDSIYIVISGRLTCTEACAHHETAMVDLRAGAVFRLCGTDATATIRASTRGWLLRLDRLAIAETSAAYSCMRGQFGDYL